jgi:hypothetical protein
VSTLPASSLGAGFFALYLMCLGIIGIAAVYLHALWDALRMLLFGLDSIG